MNLRRIQEGRPHSRRVMSHQLYQSKCRTDKVGIARAGFRTPACMFRWRMPVAWVVSQAGQIEVSSQTYFASAVSEFRRLYWKSEGKSRAGFVTFYKLCVCTRARSKGWIPVYSWFLALRSNRRREMAQNASTVLLRLTTWQSLAGKSKIYPGGQLQAVTLVAPAVKDRDPEGHWTHDGPEPRPP